MSDPITYTLTISGREITLSGSDGTFSEVDLPEESPDTDTTYSLEEISNVLTLTPLSDGDVDTVSEVSIPVITYELELDGNELTLVGSNNVNDIVTLPTGSGDGATSFSGLTGMIADSQIPDSIMRDSEFTASAVRNLLGLTETEVSNLLVGQPINNRVLTFTLNDGTSASITIPDDSVMASEDGVVTAGAFSDDNTELELTVTTDGVTSTVTINVPEALRQGGLLIPLNTDGTVPDADMNQGKVIVSQNQFLQSINHGGHDKEVTFVEYSSTRTEPPTRSANENNYHGSVAQPPHSTIADFAVNSILWDRGSQVWIIKPSSTSTRWSTYSGPFGWHSGSLYTNEAQATNHVPNDSYIGRVVVIGHGPNQKPYVITSFTAATDDVWQWDPIGLTIGDVNNIADGRVSTHNDDTLSHTTLIQGLDDANSSIDAIELRNRGQASSTDRDYLTGDITWTAEEDVFFCISDANDVSADELNTHTQFIHLNFNYNETWRDFWVSGTTYPAGSIVHIANTTQAYLSIAEVNEDPRTNATGNWVRLDGVDENDGVADSLSLTESGGVLTATIGRTVGDDLSDTVTLPSGVEIEAYSSTATYSRGSNNSIVTHTSGLFIYISSTQRNSNHDPDDFPGYWLELNEGAQYMVISSGSHRISARTLVVDGNNDNVYLCTTTQTTPRDLTYIHSQSESVGGAFILLNSGETADGVAESIALSLSGQVLTATIGRTVGVDLSDDVTLPTSVSEAISTEVELWTGDIAVTSSNTWVAAGTDVVPDGATWILFNGGKLTSAVDDAPPGDWKWINAADWRALTSASSGDTVADETAMQFAEWPSTDVASTNFTRRDVKIGRTSTNTILITSMDAGEDFSGATIKYVTGIGGGGNNVSINADGDEITIDGTTTTLSGATDTDTTYTLNFENGSLDLETDGSGTASVDLNLPYDIEFVNATNTLNLLGEDDTIIASTEILQTQEQEEESTTAYRDSFYHRLWQQVEEDDVNGLGNPTVTWGADGWSSTSLLPWSNARATAIALEGEPDNPPVGSPVVIALGRTDRTSDGTYTMIPWTQVVEFGDEYSEDAMSWHSTQTNNDRWARYRLPDGGYTAPILIRETDIEWFPIVSNRAAYARGDGDDHINFSPAIDFSIYPSLLFLMRGFGLASGTQTAHAVLHQFIINRPPGGWTFETPTSGDDDDVGDATWQYHYDSTKAHGLLIFPMADDLISQTVALPAASVDGSQDGLTLKTAGRFKFLGTDEDSIESIRIFHNPTTYRRISWWIFGLRND